MKATSNPQFNKINTIQKNMTAEPSRGTRKGTIGKMDNVKTSKERQAKARLFSLITGRSIFLTLFLFAAASFAEGPADLILLNGNVYTVNKKQPQAEAVAVAHGRIVFVGNNTDVERWRGAKTRVLDLRGRTVLPGLTDSHCHIFGIGRRERTLNLEDTPTKEMFLARVKDAVDRAAPGEWVQGRGWIETFWKPPQPPDRHDLDAISGDHPVFLIRADGHAAVANSQALQRAGVTRDTAAPFGGEILKDKTSGEPTGVLYLDKARALVEDKIPAPSAEAREQDLLAGIQRELSLGWCEIQNAGSEIIEMDLIRRVVESGRSRIRIYNACYGPGEASARLLREGASVNAFDHHLTQRTIKIVFDGALGSRGAALLQPYSDAPETSGFLREKESELKPMLREALRKGIQVETHAIGDRANRVILNLYEDAFKAVPDKERGGRSSATPASREPAPPSGMGASVRWRVEHAQILAEADLPRFAQLGVIASMQPSHAISDLFFAPARLGKERLKGAYAWNSLLKSGAVVIGGSDAPVERGEPMIEFYAAVARKSIKGESGPDWHSEQAVTREQALRMFTAGPAYAAFEEKDKGSIKEGKLADFTVLSKDIMKIPEPEILTTKCVATIVGGEVVYEAEIP